jgi:hypothetical protein
MTVFDDGLAMPDDERRYVVGCIRVFTFYAGNDRACFVYGKGRRNGDHKAGIGNGNLIPVFVGGD